ncbi:FHA domain-containing protein [Profundibacter sp.]
MYQSVFAIDLRDAWAKTAAAIVSIFIFGVSTVWAQSTELQEGPSTRYPETGIAILDCAPATPAPEDSCVVRVPPRQLRGNLRVSHIGEETGKFEFARPGDALFPSAITLSETIILIDLTPGPQGKRRATFKAEKKLIRQFVAALPAGERIAIYGFNEKMHRLADFTTDRFAVLNAIDALTLTGTNTRISTFTKDAISILAGRKQAILKNLFVISDGEEEGTRNAAEVTKAAIEANVSVSALGMFWRPVGHAATGSGMDYLRSLTEGTLGASVQLQLNRQAEASTALADFQSYLSTSMSSSGLILPVGTPRAADIVVTIKKPVIGVAGTFQDQELRVRFTPAKSDDPVDEKPAEDVDDPKEQEKMLFGYPALWVYAAAGGLAVLLLLLLLLLVRRKKPVDELEGNFDEGVDIDFDDIDQDAAAATQISPASRAPKPVNAPAYLVNTVTRKRLPVAGSHVSIGRGSSNTLIIDDDSVSRMHAEVIRNREGGYSVSDLNSLNGTYINDKKISGTGRVSAGDEIKFGEVTMRFVLA